MSKLTFPVICLTLNLTAVALLGYCWYLISVDRGFLTGAWIFGIFALMLLLVSAVIFFTTKHKPFVKVVWWTTAACIVLMVTSI